MEGLSMKSEITLVLGGAKSGKSLFAESLVLKSGLNPVYIATGRAFDDEMVERIEKHRARRDERWRNVEEPLALTNALQLSEMQGSMILVDCITLWITNLMMAEANVEKEIEQLINYLNGAQCPIVFVSNEVGQGVVPANAMAREFVDLSGLAHQKIASVSKQAYFVTAGIAQTLK